METTLRRRALFVAALLAGAILVNTVQFRTVDAAAEADRFDAVRRGGSADLVEIAYHECGWCRDRYALHIALSVVAPGSRVLVPAGSRYGSNRYDAEELTVRLLTFGAAETVELVDYQPSGAAGLLVAGVDPTPYLLATGPGGEKGAPWAVAVDPARLPAAGVNPDDYLAAALADDAHRGADPGADQGANRAPGEFLLLRWESPRPGTGYEHQDLLLETSLLPAAVREEVASARP